MGEYMSQNGTTVPCFLGCPTRPAILFAISKTLLAIRHTGETYRSIAARLDVKPETIAHAVAETSLLSTEVMVRLCNFYPDHTQAILHLFFAPQPAPTAADRFKRIDRELDALRREVGA